jgi:2-keto-3-deoxy-L-rhamnonate aldolase RhmA
MLSASSVRRIAAACSAHGKLARGSPGTEAQIEEYWKLGCKVLNLPGNDVSTQKRPLTGGLADCERRGRNG